MNIENERLVSSVYDVHIYGKIRTILFGKLDFDDYDNNTRTYDDGDAHGRSKRRFVVYVCKCCVIAHKLFYIASSDERMEWQQKKIM